MVDRTGREAVQYFINLWAASRSPFRNRPHVLAIKNIPLPTPNTHAPQRACRAVARTGYARAAWHSSGLFRTLHPQN
jgi:hypothetical protein